MFKLLFLVSVAVAIGLVLCDDCKYGDLTIKRGEVGHPKGECIEARCTDKDQISVLGCPAFQNPKGCKVIAEDLSKTYPHCCPKADCAE